MPWLELQLTVDAAQQSHAEAALEELGARSVTVLDAAADMPGETPIFAPGTGAMPIWKSLTLQGLFDHDQDAALLVAALRNALPEVAPDRIGMREVADQDWEHAWMDRYQPMQFGRRLWIYPWNIEPPGGLNPGQTIVRLDPGLAFGTGTHPTTALCLEWLEGRALAGKTLIDYGCGSGVLAIAAIKLGAAHAITIDNDPQALTATRDNAARNGVGANLEVYFPEDLPEATRADVLIANILLGPLLELAPRFAALCQPDAPIVLSGILAPQADEVLVHYAAHGFEALRVTQREEWVRIDGVRG